MTTQLQGRLAKLEAERGKPGLAPNMMHWPFLLRECEREDATFADEATYTAACRHIGPGLAWPSYSEMRAIWQRADELLADFEQEIAAAA